LVRRGRGGRGPPGNFSPSMVRDGTGGRGPPLVSALGGGGRETKKDRGPGGGKVGRGGPWRGEPGNGIKKTHDRFKLPGAQNPVNREASKKKKNTGGPKLFGYETSKKNNRPQGRWGVGKGVGQGGGRGPQGCFMPVFVKAAWGRDGGPPAGGTPFGRGGARSGRGAPAGGARGFREAKSMLGQWGGGRFRGGNGGGTRGEGRGEKSQMGPPKGAWQHKKTIFVGEARAF